MRYEWDAAKNLRNQQKHGYSFEIGTLVFNDERCVIYSDRIDENTGEARWHAIGGASIEPAAAVVLLVVHVCRENKDDEETIRIISVREADKHDLRRYQEQEMD
jgi:uncharacterized DUF497 family protein